MFKTTPNNDELSNSRENKTVDIAKRLAVITADKIHIKRFPISNPITAFNPALIIDDEDVYIYARIVLGYYTYASAVAELRLTIEDCITTPFHITQPNLRFIQAGNLTSGVLKIREL